MPPSVQDAITPSVLGQYFRAFMIKLSMIESQLGQLSLGGMVFSRYPLKFSLHVHVDDGSFAIVIELEDEQVPSVSHGKVKHP